MPNTGRLNNNRYILHSAKKLFQPLNIIPKDVKGVKKEVLPKSQRLMLDLGIIKPASNGIYSILPLGLKALNKLKTLVGRHMLELGGQKVQLPIMTDGNLWKSSSRWNSHGLDLIKLKDKRGKDYLLGPTHEESFAELIASSSALSHHQLPLLLYQITMKFRDEIKPRCGLLRTREFLMKDLYSFDRSLSEAMCTYNTICDKYDDIFKEISLPYFKVVGSTDDMGGETSHEYHIPSDIGEDILLVCESCNKASNAQLAPSNMCMFCGHKHTKQIKGVEVGHTFLLGTRYSEPLKATFKDGNNKEQPLTMGSYGLGLTRILAASIEYLSLKDQIRWPPSFAPYSIVIITPKDGSKEAESGCELGVELYQKLSTYPYLLGDILLDDRGHLTIGRRILYARQTGYPFLVIIGEGARSNPPMIELQTLCSEDPELVSVPELLNFFSQCPVEKQKMKVVLK